MSSTLAVTGEVHAELDGNPRAGTLDIGYVRAMWFARPADLCPTRRTACLSEVTERIIREEVFRDSGDAPERTA
jgi:hypothetical protein